MQATREYGDLVGFRMGPKRLYLLNHPNYFKYVLCDNPGNYHKGIGLVDAKPLLGNGLLTSEGDLWASQRRLLQAAYRRERLDAFSLSMVETTLIMLNRWQAYAKRDQPLDIVQEMVRLTVKILGFTLLHTDLENKADMLAANLTVITRWAMLRMTALLRLPLNIPTRGNLRAKRALHQLDRLVEEIVSDRFQKDTDGYNDILSLLLSDKNGNGGQHEIDKQIRDEIMTLLLAGHETTAATLAWTWYLLSQHAEVERRLHQELDQVLSGRNPTLADLPHLVYTRMLIDEVLRLYPPIWAIPRKTIAEDRIGGFTIPAQSDLLLSVYSLHRHPDFWKKPHVCDPENFTVEQSAKRAPFSYLPFGAGPRSCLGSRFGLAEVILVVATIAQRYRFERVSQNTVEPEASLTLHPRHGIPMRLLQRT
jgi:cytochrome P450